MFSTMASFKDRNAVGLSVNAATACSRVVGVLQIGADVDERCIVDGTPRLLLCTTPPADKRVQESSRIRQKYPERVPVIVEKAAKSDIPDIDKNKFLVPSDLTVGQFVYVIRKRLSLPSTKAVFLFVNNVSPPSSQLMKEVFAQHQDSDGFLYVKYSGEETFG